MKKVLLIMFALLLLLSSCGTETKGDVSVDSSAVFESSSNSDVSESSSEPAVSDDVGETSSVSDSFSETDTDADTKTILYFEGQYSFVGDIDGVFERYAYDEGTTTPIWDYIKSNSPQEDEYFFVGMCFKMYEPDESEYNEYLSSIGFESKEDSLLLKGNYPLLNTVEQKKTFFEQLFPNADMEKYHIENLKFPPCFDAVGYITADGFQQLMYNDEYILEITWLCEENNNERWIESQIIE